MTSTTTSLTSVAEEIEPCAFVYTEPTSLPIGKRERFDEDNMKPLLCDDDFNKKDRKRMSD
jgi:hypothetical protein